MNPRPGKIDHTTADDGLHTPEVGSWAEDKYRLLWCYADLFATSMKDKWDQRVYVDLFAGAGHSRVSETNRYLRGTPLLALSVTYPFDWYVFCDQDPNCISDLRKRVEKLHPRAEVKYVPGNVNQVTAEILKQMPSLSSRKRILAFCFVDPFRLRDLHFSTIQALAKRYIDFMVLIPVMDPLRNEGIYVDPSSDVVDLFVGTAEWREEWVKKRNAMSFDAFVAEFFSSRMHQLGYIYGGLQETLLVRSTEKNLPLYRLGFFSRNQLGNKFWREAKKYSNPQLDLL